MKENDTISRQAAIDAINDVIVDYIPTLFGHLQEIPLELALAIERLPAAEPRKGKWKEKQDNEWAGGGAWVCSKCGSGYAFGAYHEAFEFNYCPNCGAKMEVEP